MDWTLPSCGEWNTFKELHIAPAQPAGRQSTPAWHPATPGNTEKSRPVALTNIETGREQRFDTHDHELNRVLGGGIVPGSLILLGGEPGIGKSTAAANRTPHGRPPHPLHQW